MNGLPGGVWAPSVTITTTYNRKEGMETFIFKDEDHYGYEIDLKFFRLFSKYRLPGKLYFAIFTRKVSTATFSEGGYDLSLPIAKW